MLHRPAKPACSRSSCAPRTGKARPFSQHFVLHGRAKPVRSRSIRAPRTGKARPFSQQYVLLPPQSGGISQQSRRLVFGDSSRPQAAGFRYQRPRLRRRLMNPCQTPGAGLARPAPSARHGFSASDFSGSSKLDPSTAASGTVCVRARARARTHTDSRSINQTVVDSALGQGLDLSVQTLPSLLISFLTTRFLIFSAVTKGRPPLRGGRPFARLRRIVAYRS